MRKSTVVKSVFTIVFLIAVMSSAGWAQKFPPAFAGYRTKVEKARVRSIDFKKYPDARTYRTRLTAGLAEGVNFAGHFIIVGWGCGTGCTNAGIIDGRNGRVIWPEEFFNVDATYGDNYSDIQLDFRKNSRLLIIHGRPGSGNDSGSTEPVGDHYFVWNGSSFRKIATVPKR